MKLPAHSDSGESWFAGLQMAVCSLGPQVAETFEPKYLSKTSFPNTIMLTWRIRALLYEFLGLYFMNLVHSNMIEKYKPIY